MQRFRFDCRGRRRDRAAGRRCRRARQSTATLQGTVTDAQNAVMPGVSITVHNTATNQDRAVVTDAAGPVRRRGAARPATTR